MDFFRASTRITTTLGDGSEALFWGRTVKKELQDNNWITSVASLSTQAQQVEFINV
jgi:hypothetical protein